MKILVIGKDAKEHAICWKLTQSELPTEIFCLPGNIGTEKLGTNVPILEDEIDKIVEFSIENQIDLAIVSSKKALSKGVVDALQRARIVTFGPNKNVMAIINSRSQQKKLFSKNKIFTPRFCALEKETTAIDYARNSNYPILIKLDSDNADINTHLACTFPQAKKHIEYAFSDLNKKVIIEDFIQAKEIVLPVLIDGGAVLPLPAVRLFRHLADGDGGAITTGMASYATPIDKEIEAYIADNIVFPFLDALSMQKTPYFGLLAFHLKFLDDDTIFLEEVNSDLGNIMTQTILPLIKEDFAKLCYDCATGSMGDIYQNIQQEPFLTTTSLMLTKKPYPKDFEKGAVITIQEDLPEDVLIFYNRAIKNIYFETITDGGQILTMTAIGATLTSSINKLYENITSIDFEGKNYRKDIGKNFFKEIIQE